MRNGQSEEGAALAVLLLTVILLLVLIWLVVQAVAVTVRAIGDHPHNRALRAALGWTGLALGLMLITGGRVAPLDLLALASLIVTPLVAKAVLLYYDERLQPELTPELVLDQVLHQPWWDTAEASA